MTIPNVNRILRLRSAVRSDEMKAESTLPPAQPTSYRGVPTGAGLSSVMVRSWAPIAQAHGLLKPRVKQSTRVTVGARQARIDLNRAGPCGLPVWRRTVGGD